MTHPRQAHASQAHTVPYRCESSDAAGLADSYTRTKRRYSAVTSFDVHVINASRASNDVMHRRLLFIHSATRARVSRDGILLRHSAESFQTGRDVNRTRVSRSRRDVVACLSPCDTSPAVDQIYSCVASLSLSQSLSLLYCKMVFMRFPFANISPQKRRRRQTSDE